MSVDDEKPLVRLEETAATTADGDGNSRVRMEALSKGGEKQPDEEEEVPIDTSTTDEK